MASIRRENTRPEMEVRRELWRLGVRYRLHVRTLPGRPDIVVPRYRTAIFVHGCLWHLHEGCSLVRIPKSRPDYWPGKLARNKARDLENLAKLRLMGWRPEIVWECETKSRERLEARLSQLLASMR